MNLLTEGLDRFLLTDDVQHVIRFDDIAAVRDDDFAVPGNTDGQHARKHAAEIRNRKINQGFVAVDVEFDERDFTGGEDAVAQGVLLDQILVDFVGDFKVRVDDVVDIHQVLDERDLTHVLRIPDAGDDLAASQRFREGTDDQIGLVIVRRGNQKVIGRNADALERLDLLGIGSDGQHVNVRADLLQQRLIRIYNCDSVVAAKKGVGHSHTQFAGAYNGYFHVLVSFYQITLYYTTIPVEFKLNIAFRAW